MKNYWLDLREEKNYWINTACELALTDWRMDSEDVEYFRKKLFQALKLPKEFNG